MPEPSRGQGELSAPLPILLVTVETNVEHEVDGAQGERPRLYVASPLGFTEPTRRFYREELLPSLRAAGFEVLDPWAGPVGPNGPSLAHGENNVRLLDRANGVLAVLDGPDVDSGTAAEIGFAAAKGIPIVGVRTDARRTGESEAVTVNLQVEYFIRRDGGTIVRTFTSAIETLRELVSTQR